jgi:hypothetical protein
MSTDSKALSNDHGAIFLWDRRFPKMAFQTRGVGINGEAFIGALRLSLKDGGTNDVESYSSGRLRFRMAPDISAA